MCTKKTFSIFENLFYLAHINYEEKSISRRHPGNCSYRMMREKKIKWVDSLSSVAQVIVDP